MASYYIGTAGWSYKDWEGIVYPTRKAPSFHPLPFLARYINVVEINSTFYRPPSMRMAVSWVRRVQDFPYFRFTVKLHQVFTHDRKDFTRKDVDAFKTGIDPLAGSDRLAAILIQFPWSFVRTPSHQDYLVSLFGLFAGYPMALELRHSSWVDEAFFKLLAEHRVSFCNIDQPLFGRSIRPSAVSTVPDFSYVRLHGRNYKNWFNEKAGRDERYDYLYSREELEEWVGRIKELAQKSGKVFVITNNHYRGQAVANALQIKHMVTGEKLDIPLPLVERYPALKDILAKLKSGQLDLFGGDGNG